MSYALTAILTAALTAALAAGAGFLLYRRLASKLTDFLRSWTEPADKDTPSPLAQLADQFAVILAQRFTGSLKGAFLGMQSVDKRNEQRLQADMVQDTASNINPLLGAILTQYPAVGRRLAKNPELLGLAAQYLSKGVAAAPSNGHSPAGPVENTSMSEY